MSAPREPRIAKHSAGCLDRGSQGLFTYPLPHSSSLQSLPGEELDLLAGVIVLGLVFMVILQIELVFAQ